MFSEKITIVVPQRWIHPNPQLTTSGFGKKKGGRNMKKDNFINLHTHDEYSNIRLKDSTNRISAMIDYVANTLNQKGFAMTNHDCLSNHVKYINAIKDMKKQNLIPQDFKYILGNEVYLLDENEMNSQLENKQYVPFYHYILIALDDIGHHQ